MRTLKFARTASNCFLVTWAWTTAALNSPI